MIQHKADKEVLLKRRINHCGTCKLNRTASHIPLVAQVLAPTSSNVRCFLRGGLCCHTIVTPSESLNKAIDLDWWCLIKLVVRGGHRWRVIVCVLPSGHLTKSPPPSGWPPLTPPRHPRLTVVRKNIPLSSSKWKAIPARLLPSPWKVSTAKFSLVYATPSLLCRSQSPAPAVLPAPQFTE